MTGPETIVERVLANRVRTALGGLTFKLAPTHKGMPDRLVVLPGGRVYLVELKAPSGRVSASQRHLHAILRSLGVPVYVLTGQAEVLAWVRDRAEESFTASRYKRRKKEPVAP